MSIHARFRNAYSGFSLDVDLSLPGRGITALFGPSGSGKTTILRCMAGLERTVGGILKVNGEVWQDDALGVFLPAHKRAIGYVFQEASLFPHLSVAGNLDYALTRVADTAHKISMDQAVTLLDVGPLLPRRPGRLSGGERQRVAMARALLTSPGLLLLDEPLAALDLKRRHEILPYLERLRAELSIPMLYVSHSPDEVARLADHLVVLDEGSVVASGSLAETLARLDLLHLFGDDAGAMIEARVDAHDDHYQLTRLGVSGGAIHVSRRDAAIGQRVRIRVLARDVSISTSAPVPGSSSILNALAVTVVEMTTATDPAHMLLRLDAQGTPLLARITRRSRDQLGLVLGSAVWAQIKAVAVLG